MHSKTQGLLASLLMFIPLLAVPFVASFGVPWLAAKAKDEGLPLPELGGASRLGPGVGHSPSGKHSPDDLFAPLATQAAVDLRLASQTSPVAVQNPHLRNASLVITHNPEWVDPFERLKSSESQNSNVSPASSESPQTEDPLDGWALKEEPAEFPTGDAPRPNELFEANAEVPAPSATANPFAEFDPQSNAKSPQSQVAISDNAFEDPAPRPRINSNPNAFDASRPLFKQDEIAKATPPTEPPANRQENIAPAKVSANAGNNIQESAPALTFEAARARLKELGIKEYYIQPSANGELFHFRCAYSPPDNPRITRLFEAEAAEPLEAVRKVLGQLESWNDRQSASAN